MDGEARKSGLIKTLKNSSPWLGWDGGGGDWSDIFVFVFSVFFSFFFWREEREKKKRITKYSLSDFIHTLLVCIAFTSSEIYKLKN